MTEGAIQPDDERKVQEALDSLSDVDGSLDILAKGDDNTPTDELASSADDSATEEHFQSAPLLNTAVLKKAPSPLAVVLYSCVAAFMMVLGVSFLVYAAAVLRSRVLRAQNAWEMLPWVESQTGNYSDSDGSSPEKNQDLLDPTPQEVDDDLPPPSLLEAEHYANPWMSEEDSMGAQEVLDADFPDLITFEDNSSTHALAPDDVNADMDEEDPEDLNEFYDAPSDPVSAEPELLPIITISHAADEGHDDPPVPSFTAEPGSTPLSRSPGHRPLYMREMNSSPVSRPAWSLRADEDPSLFVPSPSASPAPRLSPLAPLAPLESLPSSLSTSPINSPAGTFALALPPARRPRAFRSPVPEFDIALAMQLRPGLGIGADPAWMVRFIMAMFGFLSVMWSNHSDRFSQRPQRRLAA